MAPRHHPARAAPFWAALLLASALLATPAVAAAASGRKVLSVETPDAAPADAVAAATPEAPIPPTTAAAAAAPDTASASAAAAPPPSDSPYPRDGPVVSRSPSPPPADESPSSSRPGRTTTRRQQRKSDGPMPTSYAAPPKNRKNRDPHGAVATPTTVTEEGAALLASAAPQAEATGAVATAAQPRPVPQINSGCERERYSSVYLDRHTVGEMCQQGLSGWKLNMRYWPLAEMSFTYRCTTAAVNWFESFRTGNNDEGGGFTVYLDRHNVDCGANSVLNEWRLIRPAGGQIAIQYLCARVPRTYNCEYFATLWNSKGGDGQVNFLDRHDVQCPGNKKLTWWRLQNDNRSQIRIFFNCCDA
ncbi:hypothetical protein Rsub_06822 [Raphidocelis subcapitata]|uniref:Uncharacterized protein n=1 Tax=Raphidocelis subcapitata TaxID=307507 RepID=A0A2V0P2B0_9CHLO|nr:hypothetical protein Rsub_06822 [Raphidocelis subcapitata]|eukprot:GBF93719.1 hypothetical protein Rsub_06822 [Raphidocelis subcapitata]